MIEYLMSIQSAILFTLAYADVFDYPLTLEELVDWIPYYDRFTKKDMTDGIQLLLHKKKIQNKKDLFF